MIRSMSTKKTPGTLTVFPAFRIIRRCLEREVQTGPSHSEVVVGTRDDIPAAVVSPAKVRCKTNFKPTADLADQLGRAVVKLSPDAAERRCRIEEEVVIPAATKNGDAAEAEIRGKARAADRETQREGTEDAANGVRILGAPYAGESIFEDVVRLRASGPALDTETEVTMHKEFRIDRSAPGVIHREVAVIPPVVAGPHISATQSQVEFVIRVPLRAWRRRNALRFLRVGLASISGRGQSDCRAQAKC